MLELEVAAEVNLRTAAERRASRADQNVLEVELDILLSRQSQSHHITSLIAFTVMSPEKVPHLDSNRLGNGHF